MPRPYFQSYASRALKELHELKCKQYLCGNRERPNRPACGPHHLMDPTTIKWARASADHGPGLIPKHLSARNFQTVAHQTYHQHSDSLGFNHLPVSISLRCGCAPVRQRTTCLSLAPASQLAGPREMDIRAMRANHSAVASALLSNASAVACPLAQTGWARGPTA